MNSSSSFNYIDDSTDQIMTESSNLSDYSATNNNEYYSSLVNTEDYYYLKKEKNSKVFPILMLVLTCLCLFSLLACIFFTLWRKHYSKSATYQLTLHYFLFKFFLVLTVCFEALTSILTENSRLHINKSVFYCSLTSYLPFSLEACINFQLLVMWLVLMSERNLTGLQCLYSDFRLKKAISIMKSTSAGLDPESPTSSSNNQQDQVVDMKVLELRAKSLRNFMHLHMRSILLFVFYVVSFFVSIHLSFTSLFLTTFGGHKICFTDYYNFSRFLLHLSVPFFFLPLLYAYLLLPTFFGKFFGGSRDPLLEQLSDSEKGHLKFIKIATFLKAIDEILIHVHSSSIFYLDPIMYKICRVTGLLLILLIAILFLFYEDAVKMVRREQMPTVSIGARDRVQNFIFKRGKDTSATPDADAIDYKTLVENENC